MQAVNRPSDGESAWNGVNGGGESPYSSDARLEPHDLGGHSGAFGRGVANGHNDPIPFTFAHPDRIAINEHSVRVWRARLEPGRQRNRGRHEVLADVVEDRNIDDETCCHANLSRQELQGT